MLATIAIGGVENCSTLSQLTATGSNTATYANAFGTADLVYVLENDALKEYIILEDSAAPNSYNFLFTLDGVTLQETDTGAAFLNAAGEAAFYLGGLFAVDANGVPTDALTYTFQTVKNNIIGVTITLDPEYLGATDRAFPVVIDPTIMISSSSTADACVCSYTPDTNYQMATQLRTGFCTDYGIRRSYIKFNIPTSIPAGSVTSARFDIEKMSGSAPNIRAYRVTGSWSSGTINYGNQPYYTSTNCSGYLTQLSSGSSWYTTSVTAIVQGWVNGTYPNYGFLLKDQYESDPNKWTTWYSSDANSPHKPELYITYSVPSAATGAILLGVTSPVDGHNHTSALQTISSELTACGYTPVQLFGSSFSADNVNNYVASSAYSIFVSRSHGERNWTDEQLFDERTLYSTYLVLDETNSTLIYDSHTSLPPDLSHMELMAFIGCCTGYRGEGANNLPTMAVAKGAATAIGFRESILCDNANDWTKEFFEKLADGYSVSEACAELARDTYYQTGFLNLYVICGDGTLTIN